MPAQSGTALDDGSLAGLAFGLERTLFVLSASLILREFWDGPVRFDYDVADSFPIRDFPLAFDVAIASQIWVTFACASATLFFSFGTSFSF
jgi:hypothetical protein